MTNSQMTNVEGMSNDEVQTRERSTAAFRHWCFVINSPFAIRHWSFVIQPSSFVSSTTLINHGQHNLSPASSPRFSRFPPESHPFNHRTRVRSDRVKMGRTSLRRSPVRERDRDPFRQSNSGGKNTRTKIQSPGHRFRPSFRQPYS